MSLMLPAALHSPSQLGVVIIELRRYLNKLGDHAARKKVAGATEAAPEVSSLTKSVLTANKIAPGDEKATTSLLHELEKTQTAAPTAHMTLADLPDAGEQQQFAEWFRANIHPLTLVTFTARSDIGGGMILQTGSHQYDMSFRAQILNNKARIAEIFAHGSK